MHFTVVPILEKSSVKAMNNLRPVALNSLTMKVMERVIKNVHHHGHPSMDPLEFTYHAGIGVDDGLQHIWGL